MGVIDMSAPREPVGDLTVGERVEWHRSRLGLTRRELAELVGRTDEWLRLLETKGRGAERLENLVLLARELRLPDLGSLTGRRFTATALELPEHPAVPAIRHALSQAVLAPRELTPACSLPSLHQRVKQAWTAWNVSRTQYTALGDLLPQLIRDAVTEARAATERDRRETYSVLVQVYLLAQRFAYGVRALDLAAQCTDRALLAADTADDPSLWALAGWAAAMTALTARRPEEAEGTALAAAHHVDRPRNADEAAHHGALLLFAAMGAASSRHTAQAWRHWDAATADASGLRAGYQHPQTMFGGANVAIYAVAINVECGNASAAVDRAAQLDPGQMPSSNRRAQHFIDLARGHDRAGDRDAVRGTLLESAKASSETIAFNADGRRMVTGLIRATGKPDAELTRLGAHLGLL